MPSSSYRRCQVRTVSSSNSSTFATSPQLSPHPAAPAHSRVGQPVSHRTIAAQVNQVATRFRVKEAGADHATTRVAAELIRKRPFRVPTEAGDILDRSLYRVLQLC